MSSPCFVLVSDRDVELQMAYALFFLVTILPRLTDNFYSKHEVPMFCLDLRQGCQSKNYMQRQVSLREKSCAFVAWCLCSIHIWGVRVVCEWRHKWRTFRPPWPTLPGPARQPLGGSISLKFLLETRLQSESLDALDDLPEFQVQKLWCKLIKIFD